MQTKKQLGWKRLLPQNTRHSTKWRVKIFKEWDSAPSNKVAANESLGFDYEEVDEVVEYLTVDLWVTKFVGEIDNRSGPGCSKTRLALIYD